MIRWLALILLCLTSAAHAMDPNRALSQYVRQRWGNESGFPRGPVYAITQTADGYLWIGTEAGLVRFDGVNFELVKDTSGQFGVASVLGLTPDQQGNLWVRLPRPTLLRYREAKFANVLAEFGLPATTVATTTRTQSGALLVWALKGEGRAVILRNNRFETVAAPAGLSRSPVMAMAETPNGEIWLGTRDAGLYRLRGDRAEAVTQGLPDLKVNCLLPLPSGQVWIGTDRGIVLWTGTTLTQSNVPALLREVQALSLTIDRDGNLWVGTNSHGLLRFNAQGVSVLPGAHEGSEAITAVFEDREGSLWIGRANSIERLRDSVFVTYSAPEGLASEQNGPVYVDATGRTWFAPITGGLHWLHNGQSGRLTEAGLERDVVYSLAGMGDDLWVGRQRGGLTRLSLRGNTISATTFTQKQGLAQNSVYAVSCNRDGSVWAGTLSGGVSQFRNGKFTTYTNAHGLASNTVASLLESADGSLWFATPQGLSTFSQDRWQSFHTTDGLPSDNVNCLWEDNKGILWIGTANGLAYRQAGRIQQPANVPASLKEQILGLVEDSNGALWIATSNHVLRVSRDKLFNGDWKEGDIREFGLTDGLQGVEGVKRHRSVVSDVLGRIWFSLNRGLSAVSPARLNYDSAPAIAHIKTIAADDKLLDLTGPIRIPGKRQRITFGFTGLGLAIPERVKFRYRLEGFDPGWSAPTTTREAPYTNLGPGVYRFRVLASNADGQWNGAEAVISFQVEPMFWQTWWFILCTMLSAVVLILALYRLRLHQLTRQMNLRFEERLAERTRIAQELHDTLLQGFLSASMQLHAALDRLPDDSPAKPSFSRVQQLIKKVTEEGRNAIRGMRSTADNPLDLEQAFSRLPHELAAQELWEQISFHVIVTGRPQTLHPILRDEIYRIGREALVNAFRHARAQRIEVELEYATDGLRVAVRDDGCGIDPQVLRSGRDGHWGLSGMRERAERIGGRFSVRSRAASGTEVELSVPSHIAFELPTSTSRWHWLKNRLGLLRKGAKPSPTESSRKRG